MERADSRALDGVLSPEEQARVERERTADPARARAVADYQDAMALWVEDARREAAAVDPQRLAERVLAAPAPRYPVTASWGYAAAAAALFAIGLGGVLALRPASKTTPDPYGVTGDVEQDRVAVLRSLELEQLGVEPK
jgi:anti-sigma factor RsiW